MTLLNPHSVAAGMADVLDELRESCRRRALPGTHVDLPGLTGVTAGTSAVLWVASWADGGALNQIVDTAPTLCELQVAADRQDVVAGLLADGWTSRGHEEQIVLDRAPEAAALPQGYRLMHVTDADQMLEVRELLISACDAPRHVIEAAYPDDFHVRAAPVSLLGVHDESGCLVGCVAWRRQHRSAMLFALAVAAPHRGRGLGQALVTAGMREALTSGASFAHAAINPGAMTLVEAVGARRVGAWTHLVRSAA